jgi:hypothetical protein
MEKEDGERGTFYTIVHLQHVIITTSYVYDGRTTKYGFSFERLTDQQRDLSEHLACVNA